MVKHAKILVVGDAGVGKSSLVKHLVYGGVYPPSDRDTNGVSTTVGCNVELLVSIFL